MAITLERLDRFGQCFISYEPKISGLSNGVTSEWLAYGQPVLLMNMSKSGNFIGISTQGWRCKKG